MILLMAYTHKSDKHTFPVQEVFNAKSGLNRRQLAKVFQLLALCYIGLLTAGVLRRSAGTTQYDDSQE